MKLEKLAKIKYVFFEIPDLLDEIIDYRIATRPRNYDIVYDELSKLF